MVEIDTILYMISLRGRIRLFYAGLLVLVLFSMLGVQVALERVEASTSGTSMLAEVAPDTVQARPAVLVHNQFEVEADQFHQEWLWLARCIYTETKRMDEQVLVAWVVRNRVETEYRGKNTYKRVILDPYQFSAFNPGTSSRRYYARLDTTYKDRVWQQALKVAYRVIKADASMRPFAVTTRHFFSERSMKGDTMPAWTENHTPVTLQGIEDERFRFYDGVI